MCYNSLENRHDFKESRSWQIFHKMERWREGEGKGMSDKLIQNRGELLFWLFLLHSFLTPIIQMVLELLFQIV